jgi:hypothetical protein
MFNLVQPQHANWVELPGLGVGEPLIFKGVAKYSALGEDASQGTVARRLSELLPPNRLRTMSRRFGTVNRIYQKSDLLTEAPDSERFRRRRRTELYFHLGSTGDTRGDFIHDHFRRDA